MHKHVVAPEEFLEQQAPDSAADHGFKSTLHSLHQDVDKIPLWGSAIVLLEEEEYLCWIFLDTCHMGEMQWFNRVLRARTAIR